MLLPAMTKKGILQINDGFFIPYRRFPMISRGSSVLRLATLFHEGAHSEVFGSDGTFRPEFTHVPCPDNGDPCDGIFHGTYGIQLTFIAFAAHACDECSAHERDTLKRVVEIYSEQIRIPEPEEGEQNPVSVLLKLNRGIQP